MTQSSVRTRTCARHSTAASNARNAAPYASTVPVHSVHRPSTARCPRGHGPHGDHSSDEVDDRVLPQYCPGHRLNWVVTVPLPPTSSAAANGRMVAATRQAPTTTAAVKRGRCVLPTSPLALCARRRCVWAAAAAAPRAIAVMLGPQDRSTASLSMNRTHCVCAKLPRQLRCTWTMDVTDLCLGVRVTSRVVGSRLPTSAAKRSAGAARSTCTCTLDEDFVTDW
jgi:hypothetical protein